VLIRGREGGRGERERERGGKARDGIENGG